MRGARYHGGFDHPVRSFVIGVTLMVLLFGGFVVGVEAGTHPLEHATSTELVAQGSVQTVTVTSPAVTTVVNGQRRLIRLSSGLPSFRTRFVVIRRGGKIIRYETLPATTGSSGPQNAAAPTVYSIVTTVVTSTQTVTETGTTDTVTVTDTGTGTTDTSGSSNSSTTTP